MISCGGQSVDRAMNENKSRHWLLDNNIISLLALIFAVTSSAASAYVYFANQADEKLKRSVVEVDRVYDRQFLDSLKILLENAYDFVEVPDNNALPHKDRFE